MVTLIIFLRIGLFFEAIVVVGSAQGILVILARHPPTDQPRDGQHHRIQPLERTGLATGIQRVWRAVVVCRFLSATFLSIADLFLRPPPDRIDDPSVDIGLLPSRAVGADPELRRDRAFVKRDRPVQARTVFRRTTPSGWGVVALLPAGCF